jgi:ubiquinone/menaquinone biosynthesis C-methylase UbiE
VTDERIDATRAQWQPLADAYLASPTHASGADLDTILAFANPAQDEVALDLGCGVGHTLRRIAARVRLAVGADATSGMLDGARTLLARAGARNVTLVVTPAERLPFLDGSFDIVTCRLAAHHFADAGAAFREVRRVLRPGGRFVLSDNYAPDDEMLDRFINTLETVRDPSHVRAHTIGAWRELLEQTGLTVTDETRGRTRIETEPWLARTRTPDAPAREARAMLRDAAKPVREAFGIDASGFDLLKVVLRAAA